jgi:hypothetical protein
MNSRGPIHSGGTVVLSLVMAALGIALIVQAIGGDGGVISGRVLLGVLFVAAGVLRLWVEYRRGSAR